MKKSKTKFKTNRFILWGVMAIVVIGVFVAWMLLNQKDSAGKYTPQFISSDVSWNDSLNEYIPAKYKSEVPSIQIALIDISKEFNMMENHYLAIDGIEISDTWLKLYGSEYEKSTNEIVPSEGVHLYGEKITDAWKIYDPSNVDFCEYAERSPKDWVDSFFTEGKCN